MTIPKIKQLIIKNIGKIADETIELNKPLILFYGEIRNGKTTILNSVRWVCGGEFPQDIIRHGEKEASIEMTFEGGFISRSFYRGKDGETKARPVQFVLDGNQIKSPVAEISQFLNPFLLDQDFLRNKNALARKQYFADLFAIDTSDLDADYLNLDREASNLRAEIKGYGEIDLTEIEPANTVKLSEQRAAIVQEATEKRHAKEAELMAINEAYEEDLENWRNKNQAIADHNAEFVRREIGKASLTDEIVELENKLAALYEKLGVETTWLESNTTKEKLERPAPPNTDALKAEILALHSPDTMEIDAALSEAAAQNVRAEQCQKNKQRAMERQHKENLLKSKTERQRAIKAEKIAKLKDISDSCGIPGLAFDESGSFTYEGTDAGMMSTSQIMKLSSALSNLYPEGFGLELLDRGESLGKSIFEFVERAKQENKTILATIVGERPAKVPDDVGVFVVTEGKIQN